MLKEDQSIVLTVSQGPTFSTLEDFTNVASTDALARLDQLGLVPNVAKVNDETVAAGTVMSWAVAEQPTAKAGDQVVKAPPSHSMCQMGQHLAFCQLLLGLPLLKQKQKLPNSVWCSPLLRKISTKT